MLRIATVRTWTSFRPTTTTAIFTPFRRISTQKPKMDRMNKEDMFITAYVGTGVLFGVPASVKTGAMVLSEIDDFPLAIPCAAIMGGLTLVTVVVAYPLLLPMYYVSRNSNKK